MIYYFNYILKNWPRAASKDLTGHHVLPAAHCIIQDFNPFRMLSWRSIAFSILSLRGLLSFYLRRFSVQCYVRALCRRLHRCSDPQFQSMVAGALHCAHHCLYYYYNIIIYYYCKGTLSYCSVDIIIFHCNNYFVASEINWINTETIWKTFLKKYSNTDSKI